MKYKISISLPVMVAICCIASFSSGILTHRKDEIWAVLAAMIALVAMGAVIISTKLMHMRWKHSRGRAIPLFEFVRDGEEAFIRGASPHMIDVGKTDLHLLVERGVDRMHCVIDAKAFDVPPFGDTYFKRVGGEMRYLRGF